MTKIADQLFKSGSKLASLRLPDGLKIIGVGVFRGQTELSNDVIVPESVTDVGYGAFADLEAVFSWVGAQTFEDATGALGMGMWTRAPVLIVTLPISMLMVTRRAGSTGEE